MENHNNNFDLSNNYTSENGQDESELRFGKIYHIIDAFIDTVNLAQNRKNALKFGVRAIGELMSEFPHEHDKEEPAQEEEHDNHTYYAHPDPNAPGSKNDEKSMGRG